MRHRRRASALRGPELECDDGLAGGAGRLAGIAECLGIAHAFEIDHDHADAWVGREIGHEVGGLEARFVSGRDHVADTDAPIFERLAKRPDNRTGLTSDCDRPGFHRHDAVIDIREQLFAGAEIAEAIRTGDGKARFLDRLLQFGGKPVTFRIL